MLKRVFSTVCLWGLVFVSLFKFHGQGGLLLLMLAAVGTQFEFYQLIKKIGTNPLIKTGIAIGCLMMICSYFFIKPFDCAVSVTDLLLIACVVLLIIVLCKGSVESIKTTFVPTLIGILYIPFTFCITILFFKHFTLLFGEFVALTIILWIVAVSKFSDVGGLIIGSVIGKHRLISEISPKKTYEGLIGGVCGSVILCCIIYCCFQKFFPKNFKLFDAIVISIVLSILALIGDLLESAIKRLSGQKDSGNIIPGIGGIFDLTDSLIFTLPIGAFLINLYK